jgi:hypothetical protein
MNREKYKPGENLLIRAIIREKLGMEMADGTTKPA